LRYRSKRFCGFSRLSVLWLPHGIVRIGKM
jgi:hypothetical protein